MIREYMLIMTAGLMPNLNMIEMSHHIYEVGR